MILATDAGLFPVDDLWAEFEHLARLASAVLNEHVNTGGSCALCRSAFPCGSAVLAEQSIALL